ncbi:retinal pigment epithelial membrane protein [Thecamonas trahens ATCC 50062]|uniref:Retinal pigment epithelial membrane protein n=1 Tax=Thecamonas trahens ATCC 50062 TaxID=461836 RepID=A0A0L0D572_THETB|nr:retinal pigment epithelial membrane protein [Thecamonas trahens ATCC 50062]KNC47484.1 retinal pigment epithelial membrane protein [Thecamonas trahens ATCC 50062]|eukprot:XP_013759420.1 retinal pigment epithelial membrane protein [Thecamonas trahens ATCC 50062]
MLRAFVQVVARAVVAVLEALIWVVARSRAAENMFLAGNFGPVDETAQPLALDVTTGNMPAALVGTVFARNGPNPAVQPRAGYHWFDGDGMVHSVKIEAADTVTYACHQLRTPRAVAEMTAGKPLATKIGDMQGAMGLVALLLAKVRGVAGVTTAHGSLGTGLRAATNNTALVYHAARFLALVENGLPFSLGLADNAVTSQDHFDFDGALDHEMTAHPKIDAATGEMFFFGYALGGPPYAYYASVTAQGVKRPSVAIDLPRPVMIHDMAVTPSFGLILDLPLVFRPADMVTKGGIPFVFDRACGARIGLMPRTAEPGSVPRWFDVEPCFVFHTAAAWEVDGGRVVVLVALRYPNFDLNVLGDAGDPDRLSALSAYLYEWRLDVRTGAVTERPLLPNVPAEFPIAAPRTVGASSPPEYVYLARRSAESGLEFDAIVKYHLASERIVGVIEFGAGKCGGEAVFVPRSASGSGAPEDDGFLLTFVYDEVSETSTFAVYSAADMTTIPMASVELGVRVPYGFHGLHLGLGAVSALANGNS